MKDAIYAFTDSRNNTVCVGAARSSVSAPGRVGINHADGRGWMVPLRMLRLATPEEMTAHFTALQAKVATLPAFKKGDVVEFDHKGQVIRGIVMSNKLLKGNRVSIDQTEAFASWKVPAAHVRLAKVQSGDAGLLNGYEVRNFHENKRLSEETLCFSANVFFNGKVVAYLANRGHGGSTDVSPAASIGKQGAQEFSHAECKAFEAALVAAAKAAGDEKGFDTVDQFVEWYRNIRPLGKSYHDYLVGERARFEEMMASTKNQRPIHVGADISKIGEQPQA
jgi:hypothetical protein